MLDFLAQTALEAIKTDSNASWIADKAHTLEGKDRLDVLMWICGALDSGNKQKVAKALRIDPNDLEATARVLRTI